MVMAQEMAQEADTCKQAEAAEAQEVESVHFRYCKANGIHTSTHPHYSNNRH